MAVLHAYLPLLAFAALFRDDQGLHNRAYA
jgi:hypothetical protein